MRGAICGLLATAALPAVASADLSGGVSVSTPVGGASLSLAAPTPSISTLSVPAAPAAQSIVLKTSVGSVSTHSLPAARRSKVRAFARSHSRATSRPKRTAVRSLMTSSTFTVPLSGGLVNPCVGEDVIFTGTARGTIDTQTSGTALSVSIEGSGYSLFATYSISEETHTWVFGPDATAFTFYDYAKMNRSGETGSPLAGDDFYMRLFVQIPTGPGGPNVNSLNSAIDGFCR